MWYNEWVEPRERNTVYIFQFNYKFVSRDNHMTVTCSLHIQFDVTNTLSDQLLENVRVEVEESEGWSVITNIPIPTLPYDHPATTYTLLEMEDAAIGLYMLPYTGKLSREKVSENFTEKTLAQASAPEFHGEIFYWYPPNHEILDKCFLP